MIPSIPELIPSYFLVDSQELPAIARTSLGTLFARKSLGLTVAKRLYDDARSSLPRAPFLLNLSHSAVCFWLNHRHQLHCHFARMPSPCFVRKSAQATAAASPSSGKGGGAAQATAAASPSLDACPGRCHVRMMIGVGPTFPTCGRKCCLRECHRRYDRADEEGSQCYCRRCWTISRTILGLDEHDDAEEAG